MNAGTVDSQLGAADLDGDKRLGAGVPDIGSDEVKDTVPPRTKLTKKPGKRGYAAKARFRFKASEPRVTFFCKVDRKKAKPCTSAYRTRVKPGKHVFKVYAVDATGLREAKARRYSWTVLTKQG